MCGIFSAKASLFTPYAIVMIVSTLVILISCHFTQAYPDATTSNLFAWLTFNFFLPNIHLDNVSFASNKVVVTDKEFLVQFVLSSLCVPYNRACSWLKLFHSDLEINLFQVAVLLCKYFVIFVLNTYV